MSRGILILVLASTLLPGAGSALAATYTVPGDAGTIAGGLSLATAGDSVVVVCGTYFEHDLILKSGVVLRSLSGDPECVAIDAQGAGRVFSGDDLDGSTRVEGITIAGGSGADGGGAYLTGGAKPRFTDCVFEGNQAGSGGGLYALNSAPRLLRCLFTANSATADGGGLALRGASGIDIPSIVSCTFAGNSADGNGGGLYCRTAIPTINLCTLSGNSATGMGGGMHFAITSPFIINTIVAFSTSGEAISVDELSDPSFFECCLFGNAGGDWVGAIAGQVGNDGNFRGDPGFCDGAGGDFTLCSDSLCLPGTLPNGWAHLLIGAHEAGCGLCGPFTENQRRTWGNVKTMYR